MSPRLSSERDDRGTSLILALVFVFVIGMVLVAVGGLAANALLNTSNARAQRTSTADAEAAVTIAMQYLRYNPAPAAVVPPSCLPPRSTIPSSDPRLNSDNPVQVVCTVDDTTSPGTRLVNFYVCPKGVTSESACETSALMLHAQVTYTDLYAAGPDECTAQPDVVTTSCGTEMNIDHWDVIGADT